jgi:hypothetical protein
MLLLEATIGFLVSILVYVVVYPLILAARGLWLLKRALSRRVHRDAPFSPRDELQDRPSHGSPGG